MPRTARLDAPGVLHHVICRGIERREVFLDDADRADFVRRLAALATDGAITLYAWALMPNHVHLLCRTRGLPLSRSMHRLLTGYVVNFNRRHTRHGHLFQNRFKSIVCQEDGYLKELVRYIHLNPLRSGLVDDMEGLERYPYCGHGALTGRQTVAWQDTDRVLSLFDRRSARARSAYRSHVAAGIHAGRRPELVGGGLVRSLGGWSEVRAARRRSEAGAGDPRILGDGDFVAGVVQLANQRLQQNLRIGAARPGLETLCRHACEVCGVSAGELRAGSRRRPLVAARGALAWMAMRELGYPGAEVARHLGVGNSCITRAAAGRRPPEVDALMKAIGREAAAEK
jgi:REP element-mobilizing transposase RayT